MEIGMGIHGEPGIRRGPIQSADVIAAELCEAVIEDLSLCEGDQADVLINGLGATPLEEQLVVSRKVHQLLAKRGIGVHRTYVGEYATSLEMAGLSVSLLKLDEELKTYMEAAADTPFFKQMEKHDE